MKCEIVKLYTPEAKKAAQAVADNDGYCPCALERKPSTKCICRDFRVDCADLRWFGKCRCGLYEKVKMEEENETDGDATNNATTLDLTKG